jgi:hypothetical protein
VPLHAAVAPLAIGIAMHGEAVGSLCVIDLACVAMAEVLGVRAIFDQRVDAALEAGLLEMEIAIEGTGDCLIELAQSWAGGLGTVGIYEDGIGRVERQHVVDFLVVEVAYEPRVEIGGGVGRRGIASSGLNREKERYREQHRAIMRVPVCACRGISGCREFAFQTPHFTLTLPL